MRIEERIRYHHRAERARIRIEREFGAKPAFPRHPQPVGDDDVGGAAAQRDLAGLRTGKLINLERKVRLLVEAVSADHRKFPGECSGFLHCKPNGFCGAARNARHPGKSGSGQQNADEIFHFALVIELARPAGQCNWVDKFLTGRFLDAFLFPIIAGVHRLTSRRNAMALAGSMRLIVCALVVLGLTGLATRADEVNDYPTSARSEYVFGCLKANGETRQAINQCSCSIDVIASLLPYDRYVTAETVLSMSQVRGNLGGEFRSSEQATGALNDLRRAQAEAEVRCF